MEAKHLIVYFYSVLIGGLGAWLIGIYGNRLTLIALPNDRSSHQHATPIGGGIGILAGFMTNSIVLGLSETFWIPAVLLSIVSFVGDRYEISFIIRLVFQLVASFIFLIGLKGQQASISHSYAFLLLATIYIAGTANYYNFMDGINGIAGIAGIIAFGLLAVFLYNNDTNANLMVINISLMLCCLGFLPFNFPRAKVFMGDVGSILLGFVFAAMVIWCSKNLFDFICLSSFLFPFYADEIATAVVRLKNREKIWQPHRRHLYQLLANELKISHWKVAFGYGIFQIMVGMSVLLFRTHGLGVILFLIVLYFSIFLMISIIVRNKVADPGR